jgi:hypothetical protein
MLLYSLLYVIRVLIRGGQACASGQCLNENLDCGFLGDECPEGDGWRCVRTGSSILGRGYCGYNPKFVSF